MTLKEAWKKRNKLYADGSYTLKPEKGEKLTFS